MIMQKNDYAKNDICLCCTGWLGRIAECVWLLVHAHTDTLDVLSPQTKTQQIRLLEQDKSTVQRELDQLRASINDGTTEVQRLVARDRRVQEEIVRELQVREKEKQWK